MPTIESKRVWIVDDSPLDVERACRVLGGECQVEAFQDGSAALERLASSAPPDVMVLDWVMPGVSGVDVCRFLRSDQGGHPEIGILLLTTHRHTEQIVEGLSAGANDYLAKPYEDEELRARVHSLLRTRQLLERAEQAEALSSKLLQMAPDALIAIDDERRIAFFNETASSAVRPAGELTQGAPLAQYFPELDRRLRTLLPSDTLHLPDVEIAGRVYAISGRTLPSSKALKTILSLRDITESRRRDERRLDFYSIIAHDLRSPLNTLTLRTQLMLGGDRGELPPNVESDLRKFDVNLKSLIEMINDFLDLARLDNRAYEVQKDEIDLASLLQETFEELRPQLEARKLSWVNEAKNPAIIIGDVRRLQQVVNNLIGNAIKFTPPAGTITARIEPRVHELEVSVIDTGRGIPEERQTRLFDRYTRVTDKSDKTPGTGLGLMIVREIVEAHGGSVGVESKLGVGSRFWFRVPKGTPVPETHGSC
ncbi:MAG TPA: ATP-binding protein [Polyangiales bacterium]|nr:ATP-binding protein [Polyangiales bacterium]